MYPWIWRHLPGGAASKLAGSLVLLVGVLALLFFLVFPWAEPRLPFNHVTVDTNGTTTQVPTSTPSPTGSSSPRP